MHGPLGWAAVGDHPALRAPLEPQWQHDPACAREGWTGADEDDGAPTDQTEDPATAFAPSAARKEPPSAQVVPSLPEGTTFGTRRPVTITVGDPFAACYLHGEGRCAPTPAEAMDLQQTIMSLHLSLEAAGRPSLLGHAIEEMAGHTTDPGDFRQGDQ